MRKIIPYLVAITLVLPAIAATSDPVPAAPTRAPERALSPTPQTALPGPGQWSVHDNGDVLTIQYGGRSGAVGIPSWKAVLRRDDGGNISALHVPADSPTMLAARERSLWPLTTLATSTGVDMPATMSHGRENYAGFVVETFKVVERSPEKIVLQVGGPSKNKHYEHQRIYTFTPVGVRIEGEVLALIELRSIGFWALWDRRQIADSHIAALPVRTQGRPSWVYMPSTGRDGAMALPAGVKFPLEAELRLRRPEPTFVKVFFDQNFESSENKPLIVHNDKDMRFGEGPMHYEKLVCMVGGAVSKGQRQTFKLRYEFENRQWPLPRTNP